MRCNASPRGVVVAVLVRTGSSRSDGRSCCALAVLCGAQVHVHHLCANATAVRKVWPRMRSVHARACVHAAAQRGGAASRVRFALPPPDHEQRARLPRRAALYHMW